MSGVVVFTSLRAALNAGYHVYGRTERGYLARLRTDGGWALAVVECVLERSGKSDETPDAPAQSRSS
ncbi:MAG TPA: hypothetical protein VFW34_03250 [Candidatus Rubrimentiphilum sp.]|nr:hypothetical protein [Candidatus Rubrimentiphilum sp.]